MFFFLLLRVLDGPFWAQPCQLEVVVSQSRHMPLNCHPWKQHDSLHLENGWLEDNLGGGLKIFVYFHPELLGEIIQLDEHIFQLGWFSHQLAILFFWDGGFLVWTVSCRECDMNLYHAVPMSLGRTWKMNFSNDPHPFMGYMFVKSLECHASGANSLRPLPAGFVTQFGWYMIEKYFKHDWFEFTPH